MGSTISSTLLLVLHLLLPLFLLHPLPYRLQARLERLGPLIRRGHSLRRLLGLVVVVLDPYGDLRYARFIASLIWV